MDKYINGKKLGLKSAPILSEKTKLRALSRKLLKTLSSALRNHHDLIEQISDALPNFGLWSSGRWIQPLVTIRELLRAFHLEIPIAQYFYMFHNNGQKMPRLKQCVEIKPADFAGLMQELLKRFYETKVQLAIESKEKVALDLKGADMPDQSSPSDSKASSQIQASNTTKEESDSRLDLGLDLRLDLRLDLSQFRAILSKQKNKQNASFLDETCLFLLMLAILKTREQVTNLIIFLIDNQIRVPPIFLALADPNLVHRDTLPDRTTNYQTGEGFIHDDYDSDSDSYSDSSSTEGWMSPENYFSSGFAGKTFYQVLLAQREGVNGHLVYLMPHMPYWDINYYGPTSPSALSSSVFLVRDPYLLDLLLRREDISVSHNYNEIMRKVIVRGMSWIIPLIQAHPNYQSSRELRQRLRSHRTPDTSSDVYPEGEEDIRPPHSQRHTGPRSRRLTKAFRRSPPDAKPTAALVPNASATRASSTLPASPSPDTSSSDTSSPDTSSPDTSSSDTSSPDTSSSDTTYSEEESESEYESETESVCESESESEDDITISE